MSSRGFADPEIAEPERRSYRGVLRDQEIGTGTFTVVPHPDRYDVTVQLRGALSGVETEIETRVQLVRERGLVRAESYETDARVEGEHGRSTAHDEGRLLGVKALSWGGSVAEYPADIMPLIAVPLVLRGLFTKGARVDFPLWLASVVYWPVHAKVEGAAKVETPAGRIDAWKVRFRPDLHGLVGPLDRVVQPIIPPFIGYFAKRTPNELLRFEFPTGPFPWNPRGAIEQVAVASD